MNCTTTKICCTCKKSCPAEMFTKSTRTADGLEKQCKQCRAEYVARRRLNPEVRAKEVAYSAKHYKENREKIEEKTTAWRKTNPEKARASVNKYAEKNREQKRAADRARYHRDLEASRAAGRAKYAKNPESGRVERKNWRERNKDLVRAWGRAWTQLNKEKYAARAEHRRNLKAHMSEFDKFVMQEAAKLCVMRQVATGFTWQIDHVVPLAKGGNHAAENLQVVPAAWNAAKRDRHCDRYFG